MKYHHGDLKTQLMENGLIMIQEEGKDKLSLRKLAKTCGVSEAAPYAHFRNKEELLEAIQEYTSVLLYDSLNYALETTADPTVPHALFDMGIAYVNFFMEHPSYFSFIFSQPTIRIDLSMKGEDDYKPFALLRDTTYRIMGNAGYSEEQIKYGVISMWAQVHGIASIVSMPCVKTDFEWKEVLEKIMVN